MVLKDHVSGSAARRGVVLVAAAMLLVGCSSGATPSAVAPASQAGSGGGTSVTAALTEYKVDLGATSAPAGPVTFQLTNKGTIVHEFVVFKTDLAGDKLPMSADGATADEAGAGMAVVDEVEDIEVGATPTLAVDLPAGHYVVLCNVEAHYKSGMWADFTTN